MGSSLIIGGLVFKNLGGLDIGGPRPKLLGGGGKQNPLMKILLSTV